MTEAQIKELVASLLSDFTSRLTALEAAHTKEVAELKANLAAATSKLGTVEGALATTKTEFTAALADDAKRLEAVGASIAKQFAGVIGSGTGPNAAPPARQTPEPSEDEKKVTAFDALLTTSFAETKSKEKAWARAAAQQPDGYRLFIAARKRPSFDVPAK